MLIMIDLNFVFIWILLFPIFYIFHGGHENKDIFPIRHLNMSKECPFPFKNKFCVSIYKLLITTNCDETIEVTLQNV